jgi:DNA-binding transcriptional MerR regulator/methylmalonyl-CoA mutase cobalamin-binding subunit
MVKRGSPEALEPRPITIGALSRATQIPVETLRTWERRYHFPLPDRKPSGHRLYPVATIDHLRRIARLLESGHRPAEILKLSMPELDALLAAGDGSPTSDRRAPATHDPQSVARSLKAMLRAAAELDRKALLTELESHWARLGPLAFLEEIAAPFLTRLGEAWEAGTIQVRHEHFASAALFDFLRAVRGPFEVRARGPRVIVSTPPGEQHEGGILMTALVLSTRGRRVIYLGTSTPVGEIAAASHQRGVEAVSISISSSTSAPEARRFLTELRRELPRMVELWVGGSGAPESQRGVDRFETLAELDQRLARR